MLERGISVDHTTLNRWVVKYSPELETKFMKYKRPAGAGSTPDFATKVTRTFIQSSFEYSDKIRFKIIPLHNKIV